MDKEEETVEETVEETPEEKKDDGMMLNTKKDLMTFLEDLDTRLNVIQDSLKEPDLEEDKETDSEEDKETETTDEELDEVEQMLNEI